MAAASNHSAERVVLLLVLLTATPEPLSREEVFQQIALYQERCASPNAQCRMFERDLNVIESCGIKVEHRLILGERCYRALFP